MLVCLPSNGNMTYMELHVEEPLYITIAASSLGPIMVLMASFFSFFFSFWARLIVARAGLLGTMSQRKET